MTKRIAILVTGSREWSDGAAIHRAMLAAIPDDAYAEFVFIHGDAPGADQIADVYARRLTSDCVLPMPAQWDRDGKAAGPRRNAEMVRVMQALRSCGYECHVLAFPIGESRGTRDCIAKAKAAGFDVRVVEGDDHA